MALPASLTTVTPLSKTVAAMLFVIVPVFGFFLGMEYEKSNQVDLPCQVSSVAVFSTKEECEQTTGYVCESPNYEHISNGNISEEVCNRNQTQGWVATDWKTHTSDIMQFTIMVPDDFEVYMDEEVLDVTLRNELYSATFTSKNHIRRQEDIYIRIEAWKSLEGSKVLYDNPNYNFEDYILETIASHQSLHTEFSRKNRTLDNKPAIQISYKKVSPHVPDTDSYYIITFVQSDSMMYEILVSVPYDVKEQYMGLVHRVLGTFKSVGEVHRSDFQMVISNGSVYKISYSGTEEVLLDKEDYKKYHWNGDGHVIYDDPDFHFNKIQISPDKSKIITLADGGISISYLHYLSLDQVRAQFIDFAVSAAWSPNGRYIAYTTKPADAGAVSILRVFDTETSSQITVTNKPVNNNIGYDFLGFGTYEWLDDSSGIRVQYEAYKSRPDDPDPFIAVYGEVVDVGQVVIPIQNM